MEIPEPIQDLVLSNVHPVDDGIEAFRRKDYAECIQKLTRALDKNKDDFRARMFLAMAFYASGASFPAVTHLKYLVEHCPDKLVQEKSKAALDQIENKIELARRQEASRRHYGAVSQE